MTISEAILTLNANVLVACGRAGFSSATVKMIEDALNIIEDALKAQEPRVVKMSELTAGEPMLVWLEDIDKEETVAGMIFDYVPGRLGFKLTDLASMDRIYPRIEEYLTRWRCWTCCRRCCTASRYNKGGISP